MIVASITIIFTLASSVADLPEASERLVSEGNSRVWKMTIQPLKDELVYRTADVMETQKEGGQKWELRTRYASILNTNGEQYSEKVQGVYEWRDSENHDQPRFKKWTVIGFESKFDFEGWTLLGHSGGGGNLPRIDYSSRSFRFADSKDENLMRKVRFTFQVITREKAEKIVSGIESVTIPVEAEGHWKVKLPEAKVEQSGPPKSDRAGG